MSNPPRLNTLTASESAEQKLRRQTIWMAIAAVVLVIFIIIGAATAKAGDDAAAAKIQSDISYCQKSLGGSLEECQRIVGRMNSSRPRKTDEDHINDAARSLDNYCSVRPEKC
jgi:hypothetical protein